MGGTTMIAYSIKTISSNYDSTKLSSYNIYYNKNLVNVVKI